MWAPPTWPQRRPGASARDWSHWPQRQPLHPILAQKLTEATHLLLPHDMGALVPGAAQILADHLDGYASLLIGPGLGQAPETIRFVHQLLGIDDAARSAADRLSAQTRPAPHTAAPAAAGHRRRRAECPGLQ